MPSDRRGDALLAVLAEQNRTAPMVSHGCPASKSSRLWARTRTSGSAAGEAYVVGGPLGAKYRAASKDGEIWKSVNLRSNLLKILKRAGVAPWASLWNSMRSSLITDLSQDGHPIQVITAWVGNSPDVALSNYLQVLERDFEKAAGRAELGGAKSGARVVQNAVQPGAAGKNREQSTSPQEPCGGGFSGEPEGPDRSWNIDIITRL